jgi:predicted Zn-dependent peptidase
MKTIKIDNKPVLYNNKDVNRVCIDIIFPVKTDKESTPLNELLKRLMGGYSDKYRDNASFFNEMDSLYILKYGLNNYAFKEINYLNFSLVLPKDDIIDEYDLEKALRFFKDSIYNPCIDNDHFDDKLFDLEKDYLLEREKRFPYDIDEYIGDKFWRLIDKKEELGLHHDNYVDYLNKTTSKDVYKYYMDNIYNNNYLVYIYGNLKDKNKYLEVFNKVFNRKENTSSKKVSFYGFRKNYKYVHKEEVTKYNQSVLCLSYTIKGMRESEVIIFDMLHYFLKSKENALIFNELRTKNNLIYSCKIYQKRHYGFFNVFIYFNDIDYKDIINYVNSSIKSLYDKNVFEECKERLVRSLKYDLLYKEDEPFDKVLSKREVKLFNGILFEKRISIIENTSYEEFIRFLDKVILTYSYLFTGGDNDA